MADETPNPGSLDAFTAGCTCPRVDNHYGDGVLIGGKRSFWISAGCPLHDPEDEWGVRG